MAWEGRGPCLPEDSLSHEDCCIRVCSAAVSGLLPAHWVSQSGFRTLSRPLQLSILFCVDLTLRLKAHDWQSNNNQEQQWVLCSCSSSQCLSFVEKAPENKTELCMLLNVHVILQAWATHLMKGGQGFVLHGSTAAVRILTHMFLGFCAYIEWFLQYCDCNWFRYNHCQSNAACHIDCCETTTTISLIEMNIQMLQSIEICLCKLQSNIALSGASSADISQTQVLAAMQEVRNSCAFALSYIALHHCQQQLKRC